MSQITIVPLPPQSNTMTSVELHRVVFEATGKFAELGNFHAHTKKVLINQSDCILQSAQKRSNGQVSWYNLNEVQCNMVMASIDLNHLELIAKVFVFTKNSVINQSGSKMELAQVLGNKQDTFLTLGLMAKEFNVNGSEKIKMFEKGLVSFPDLQNALPSYSSSKFEGTAGEVSERVAHAYAYHRKSNYFQMSSIAFNKLMVTNGYLEEKVTSSGKKFKSVTELGLQFGKNVSAKQNSTQVQPHWYDDSIVALYESLT